MKTATEYTLHGNGRVETGGGAFVLGGEADKKWARPQSWKTARRNRNIMGFGRFDTQNFYSALDRS